MPIHLGIGSWGDDAYVGVLYPRGLPKADRLREYARSLDHVEVNSTYYAIPPAPTLRGWLKQTPPGFTFSLKLHRAVAQSPAKAADGALLKRLLLSAKPLLAAQRVPTFFLVLPPRFSPERHALTELDGLVRRLAPHPLAVELRHRAWVTGRQKAATLAYFRERKLIWIAVDMPRLPRSTLMPPVDEVTHPTIGYLRLHGRNPRYEEAGSAAEGHHYLYSAPELRGLVTRIRKLAAKCEHLYVIANNHAEDFAPRTALALQQALGGRL